MAVDKVNLRDISLYFVYKPPTPNKNNLNSAIEIKFDELYEDIKRINSPQSCFMCESGWSFNKPEKITSKLSNYKLFYFILSPSIIQLRQRYLKRHPKSKIVCESDWENQDKIFEKGLKANKRLKQKLNSNQFLEFSDECLEHILEEIKLTLFNKKEPTIFIVSGPNASGKSTLVWELMRSFK